MPVGGEVGQHGFDDRGVGRGGGGVVEVDAVVQARGLVGSWGDVGGGHRKIVAQGGRLVGD